MYGTVYLLHVEHCWYASVLIYLGKASFRSAGLSVQISVWGGPMGGDWRVIRDKAGR